MGNMNLVLASRRVRTQSPNHPILISSCRHLAIPAPPSSIIAGMTLTIITIIIITNTMITTMVLVASITTH